MKEVNLKDLLNQIISSKGFDACEDNSELYEWFECISETVWTSEPDRHRWYTLYDVVRKISYNGEEYYFQDVYWDVHGEEATAEDCGWKCPDVNTLVQVYPKETKTITYVTKEELVS